MRSWKFQSMHACSGSEVWKTYKNLEAWLRTLILRVLIHLRIRFFSLHSCTFCRPCSTTQRYCASKRLVIRALRVFSQDWHPMPIFHIKIITSSRPILPPRWLSRPLSQGSSILGFDRDCWRDSYAYWKKRSAEIHQHHASRCDKRRNKVKNRLVWTLGYLLLSMTGLTLFPFTLRSSPTWLTAKKNPATFTEAYIQAQDNELEKELSIWA